MKHRSYLLTALASTILVIWLSSCGQPKQATLPLNQPQAVAQQPAQKADVTVTIHGFKFDPPLLKIATGKTVKFVNKDEDPHTATAQDGSFNSKALDKDDSWTYTFTKPGTFPYICAIHPFMKGTIIASSTGK